MIYCIVFFMVIYFSFFASVLYKRNIYLYKALLISAMVCVVLIVGLRENIGMDYNGYVSIYHKIGCLDKKQLINSFNLIGVEQGFVLLNYICMRLGLGYRGVFLIVELISIIFIYMGINYWIDNKNEVFIIISVYMSGIFFASMNGIRQFMAVSIMFYCFRYMYEKKLYKYILSIILLSSIHISILFLIPVYLLRNFNINKKRFLFICALIAITGRSMATFFYNYILPNIGIKYSGYSNISGYNIESFNSGYLNFFMLLDLIIAYALICFRDVFNSKEKFSNNIFLFFVIIKLGFGGFPLIARFNNYFLIFSILSSARILKAIKLKYKELYSVGKSLIFSYYVILYIYSIYIYSIRPENMIVPYKSILS